MKKEDNSRLRIELDRCVKIFNTGIFDVRNKNLKECIIFRQSAFIEILIHLDYLLKHFDKNSKRFSWKDDVVIVGKVSDITDLVREMRNAACHIDSDLRKIHSNEFSFNIISGKTYPFIIEDVSLGCDYDDDSAFFYGVNRLYLKRHIKRLLEELIVLII